MYNLQANGLNQAILRSHNPKLYLLAFEPFMIKKSELKALSVGDLMILGKKLPQLYIYRKGGIVGQAELGVAEGKEVVIILAKERIDTIGKAESKYTLLESRIATISKASFTVGKLVALPVNSLKQLPIFVKEKLIAIVSLVQTEEGYAFQIDELH